ncbi:RNA polymerase sigma factor [Amycolatopsis sp. Hca4]|uniref:RNA polymerase sigma factor n=1 Tax=Amycolatopsis sp. Hca4 TaxID=2742131 RepID=UPI001591AA7E|nr:RNA polymerase sigma factor [Amycolatopsis sp. Hca4]QKV80330.1 RNA polymerase sigma factor [Amycolatopsis sp. Hca4]
MTSLRSVGDSDPPVVGSDAELVTGDAEQFGLLFDRHAGALHRYCAGRVGAEVAEDVVADVFCVAFKQRDRYDADRANALPWLYGIATNLLRRRWRQEAARYRAMAKAVPPLAGGDEPALRAVERTHAAEYVRLITSALGQMPRRQRDVLLLFALADLDYGEIATALAIPVGTVRSALHRARKRLRDVLPAHADTSQEMTS